ncbi:uncharacterized protein TRIADDRAFT_52250 [Trichoplax adhaerens]|uniref:G-protein coupled receptors family 1 profile domain-containing protein n=1 Tax=Trichoplax adhaerens TaxID=10228 RepID=B3RM64_TRIAD|nr:hypothetical protein TRIADDRAFT_52250 [Trichoplax adhaerens]EDV29642.1 hypothetical protein TRIADDRAFT_52250 [Trichoplax adhaerens]|eukprot:XP_002108844.1 hypothetical protein TRIADDRAFT_52250 [Trichoplax adhaerens]
MVNVTFQIQMSEEFAVGSMIILVFIFAVGLCGNAIICCYKIKDGRKMKVQDILVFNLAFSDASYVTSSFIGLFQIFFRVYLNQLPIYKSNTLLCRLNICIPFYFGVVNVFSMALLAIVRYLAINKPRTFLSLSRKSYSLVIFCLINWLVPALLAFPQAFRLWGGVTYISDVGFCYTIYHYSQGLNIIIFFTTVIVGVIVVPLTIIFLCYWKIYQEVRRNRSRIAYHDNRPNVILPATHDKNRSLRVRARSNSIKSFSRKREIYVATTLFIILLTFTLSYIPYSIIAIIAFFRISPYQIRVHLILLFVTYLGNIANPIIFIIRNNDIRKWLKRLFPSCSLFQLYSTTSIADIATQDRRV